MTSVMDRRTFLAGTGAVLLAAPLAAEGQQAGKVWRIGLMGESSRRAHVLTIASKEEQLNAGFSLGVFAFDGKTTITVNLTASREEGAAFSSELLHLARVIR